MLSAGYESAAESAKATDRNASNRTTEQLEKAYSDALAKGLVRFTELDAQKEVAVDKEEKGKPQKEHVVQTEGEIIYNHKIQVGEGKNIRVVTQVFLKKGEGFLPENHIEEPKEEEEDKKANYSRERENKKREARNDEEKLQVGSFANIYKVKDKKITGIIASSNEKTNIAQEGQREINMTEIVKQQCQLAINFKQKNIKGFLNSWKTKAVDNVDKKVDPGETQFPMTIERSPTPSTDTGAVLAYIETKKPNELEIKLALFGTAHAVVPNVLAKENGIISSGIQVKLDGNKILYTLSR